MLVCSEESDQQGAAAAAERDAAAAAHAEERAHGAQRDAAQGPARLRQYTPLAVLLKVQSITLHVLE